MHELTRGIFGEDKIRKISLNLDTKTLELVDDLVELSRANRTIVMHQLIQKGVKNYFKDLERTWEEIKLTNFMITENNHKIPLSEEQLKKLDNSLDELKKLKQKWFKLIEKTPGYVG